MQSYLENATSDERSQHGLYKDMMLLSAKAEKRKRRRERRRKRQEEARQEEARQEDARSMTEWGLVHDAMRVLMG